MSKKRIMVVEDEGITAMRIKNSLEQMGYDVTSTVYSGEEALAKAGEDSPDLVIMDIVLAGKLDGIEAAGQIRALLNVPIVYLTAHSDEKMLKRIKDTEPFGYINKPFDDRELRVIVEIAFYKHETEQRLKEHKEGLEAMVRERTSELESAFEQLQHAEKKLRLRAEELEESNTALKVYSPALCVIKGMDFFQGKYWDYESETGYKHLKSGQSVQKQFFLSDRR
jgi:CheY-like chemotaxis protein